MPLNLDLDIVAVPPNTGNPEAAFNTNLAKIVAALQATEDYINALDVGGTGLPPGGLVGQILAKLSDADGDADWIDPPVGGGGGSTFKKYRYYKYSFVGTYGNNAAALGDIDHYSAETGESRVQPVATNQGSSLGGFGDLTANNLRDQQPTTIWHSNGTINDNVTYDFGVDGASMSKVKFTQANDSNRLAYRPINAKVEASDDNATWTLIQAQVALVWSADTVAANTAEIIASSGTV